MTSADLQRRLASGRAGLPVAVVRGEEVLPFPLLDQLRPGDQVRVVVRPADRVELPEPDPVP